MDSDGADTPLSHLVQIEPRGMRRLVKLAKRVQCRFWALTRDLGFQGPRPRGWASLAEVDQDSYCCHIDFRYLAGWTRWSDGSLEIDAPALSLDRLTYLKSGGFSELLLRLDEPPVELRLTGTGASKFLAQLRERYPGQITAARELLELPQTEWYQSWESQMTTGKCLHVYRQNAGLSLPALAEISGLHRRELAEFEDGVRALSPEHARLLAQYLECEPQSLLDLSHG